MILPSINIRDYSKPKSLFLVTELLKILDSYDADLFVIVDDDEVFVKIIDDHTNPSQLFNYIITTLLENKDKYEKIYNIKINNEFIFNTITVE